MAMSSCHPAIACRPAAARAGSLRPPFDWPGRTALAALRRWFAAARLRRGAIRELRRLSDGQLCDIGIGRCEIDEVVDELLARGRLPRAGDRSLRGF